MIRKFAALAVGAVLAAAALALPRRGHGHGEEQGPAIKVLSAVDVEEVVDGKKCAATTFEVTFAPGAAGSPHRHPGPIFGYVLEGELEFAVGQEKPRTLKAGEAFYEPAMALHSVSRNPSARATTRVLAVLLHPRDAKELVIAEPAYAEPATRGQ